MDGHLMPQDELTLDLLATVLAEMYLHSLKSEDKTSTEAQEGETEAAKDEPDQSQGQAASSDPAPVDWDGLKSQ